MPKVSAGLLMYRQSRGELEVFLVHPGGPAWANKDAGAWSIPKGQYERDEAPFHAAVREFREETGFEAEGPFLELGTVRQASGKLVTAWAFAGECDPNDLVSNFCSMEWPPRSGKRIEFPEVDRGRWFSLQQARESILQSQATLLDRLLAAMRERAE